MKRPLIAIGLLLAAAAPLPSLAHSDVSVRVNLGWPAIPVAVHYDSWGPAPYPVHHAPVVRPVVIYREYDGRRGRGHHHRGRGHGHHAHHHDHYCRH